MDNSYITAMLLTKSEWVRDNDKAGDITGPLRRYAVRGQSCVCACACVCMCVCLYVCASVGMCARAHARVCVCACVWVSMFVLQSWLA